MGVVALYMNSQANKNGVIQIISKVIIGKNQYFMYFQDFFYIQSNKL